MTWLRSVSHASADLSRSPGELQATRTARYKTLHAMRCNADSDCGVPRGRPGCDAHCANAVGVLCCDVQDEHIQRLVLGNGSECLDGWFSHVAQACSQAIGGIGCCRSLFARAV